MGCPGGTRSVFTRAFRAKMYISLEKGDHYYIQTRHNDLFSEYILFLGKRKEKLARKARGITVASISDLACEQALLFGRAKRVSQKQESLLAGYIGSCSIPLGIP